LSGAIGLEQLKKVDHFVKVRRENAALWVSLFKNDERFIIQKENGTSSWFSFALILNPAMEFDRKKILGALKKNNIQYRIITGGNFLRHDVIKYCNHDIVGEIINANIAHDFGFFVGNHPKDIKKEIQHFHEVIDRVAIPSYSSKY
ncbi:MAG TPA: DegT/DnrJ/EryC1/StrS family aminotransferase, partial [Chlamydiales bacterium]|nr:DegT/DnrJ/EryC1/StrS family aminotransferase [Chlamydiales bacterium]